MFETDKSPEQSMSDSERITFLEAQKIPHLESSVQFYKDLANANTRDFGAKEQLQKATDRLVTAKQELKDLKSKLNPLQSKVQKETFDLTEFEAATDAQLQVFDTQTLEKLQKELSARSVDATDKQTWDPSLHPKLLQKVKQILDIRALSPENQVVAVKLQSMEPEELEELIQKLHTKQGQDEWDSQTDGNLLLRAEIELENRKIEQ